jgi:outer membrane protein OmpA-like peptidoglycan-associated protein
MSCCSWPVFAQTNQMLRAQGDLAMKNKDWYGASQYYYRLYSRDSSSISIQYKLAEASRRDFDLAPALRLYLKVAAYDNGRRFPLTFYYIGEIHKNNENYKEAKKWFQKYEKLQLKKEQYVYFSQKAKIEIEACDLALLLISNPLKLNTEHLDQVINTNMSEYAAYEKDSSLYFSSVKGFEKRNASVSEPELFSKIYKSDFRKGKWQRVKAMDTTINASNIHNANTCFSPDGTQMIISRCRKSSSGELQCHLYISNLVNKKWTTAQKMGAPVNQNSITSTQPCFGEIDGKTVLFFSSNRKGGSGGLDIWYSTKNPNGSFEKPINAGKKVNSPDDEITPWFNNIDQSLYFSSTYHKGLGGFDVFKSAYYNSSFDTPQNAGYPLNSSLNDVYYSENASGFHMYVSSNRKGSHFENKINCCNDIYRFTKVNELETDAEPRIKNIDSTLIIKTQIKLLVPLTLYFNNDEPDSKTWNITTKKNYEETFFNYNTRMNEYIKEYSRGLKGDEKVLSENRISNFFTDSLQAGMEALNQFSELLEKLMTKRETVKITIKGYCSPLASSDYNINLAKRRTASLRNYFMAYKNGWFLKYIESPEPGEGAIIFEDVDIGELPVSTVSDDVKDKRNSIYSPNAASERKIQVIAVGFE